MLRKLRLRFVLVNMAIVTVMLLVIFGLTYHFTSIDLANQRHVALQTLSQGPSRPGTGNRVSVLYIIIESGHNGSLVASGNTYHDLSDETFIQELTDAVHRSGSNSGYIEKFSLQYVVSNSPGGFKLVFVDTAGHNNTLMSLVQTSVLVMIIALVIFALISIILAKWAVNPVEKAWAQQKQFVSDASHELKTPLTVIMSNAELLLETECSDPNRIAYTGNIISVSKQMRNLVNQLLDLTRADNGQIKAAFEAIDISAIIENSILPFEPILFEAGLAFNSSIEPGIIANGSKQHLQQVIDILLDNAQKYSAPGTVSLCLKRQGHSHCLLTVETPGTPINAETAKHIFDRFYRADAARSNTTSLGLGLSIAKAIIEDHNGKIYLETTLTSNRFCVQLPCQPQ